MVGRRGRKLFLAVIVDEHIMEVAALLQTGTPRRAGLRCGKIRGPREPRPPPPRQHHLLRCIRGAKVFWGTERATQLLLAELASLCTDGGWAGRITACLASEGLGCIVKIIHPVDKNARVKQDARVVSRGRGRKDLTFDDNRWSKTYVATGPHTALRVRGTGGKEDAFVEEATITFTKHVVERRVSTQPELEALKVADVGEDTNVEGLSHFAAIVRNDGNSRPFSVHEAAPPLYTSKARVDVCSRAIILGSNVPPTRTVTSFQLHCCCLLLLNDVDCALHIAFVCFPLPGQRGQTFVRC